MVKDTEFSAASAPKRFVSPSTIRDMAVPSVPATRGELGAVVPLKGSLDREGKNGKSRKKRGDGESSDEVVVIVENLHLQGHGDRLSTDMPRNHRNGPELPHGAGVA